MATITLIPEQNGDTIAFRQFCQFLVDKGWFTRAPGNPHILKCVGHDFNLRFFTMAQLDAITEIRKTDGTLVAPGDATQTILKSLGVEFKRDKQMVNTELLPEEKAKAARPEVKPVAPASVLTEGALL